MAENIKRLIRKDPPEAAQDMPIIGRLLAKIKD